MTDRSAEAIKALRSQIGLLRNKSTDGRHFIDPNELNNLLSKSAIADAVGGCGVPEYQQPSITEIHH